MKKEQIVMHDAQAEILRRIKPLARRYRELTGRPLGVTGEVGEFEATRLLRVRLAGVRQPGFDAKLRRNGREERLEIKTRVILPDSKPGQNIGSLRVRSRRWNAVLLVLLDERYDATEIWRASRTSILRELRRPGSNARRRGVLTVEKFKSVGRRVWP
jgi:hypothetical protein